MKLARYTDDGRTTIGVIQADQVFDIDRLDPTAPKTIRELIAARRRRPAAHRRLHCAIVPPAARSRRSGSKRRSPTRRSTWPSA